MNPVKPTILVPEPEFDHLSEIERLTKENTRLRRRFNKLVSGIIPLHTVRYENAYSKYMTPEQVIEYCQYSRKADVQKLLYAAAEQVIFKDFTGTNLGDAKTYSTLYVVKKSLILE